MTLPVDKNSRLNIKPPEETAKKDEQKTKYANPVETNRHTPSESSDTYSNEQNIHNRIITEMTDTDSIEDDSSETQLLFTDEDFSCIDLDSWSSDYISLIEEHLYNIENLIENHPVSDPVTTVFSDTVDFKQIYNNQFFNALLNFISLLETYEKHLIKQGSTDISNQIMQEYQKVLDVLSEKESSLNNEQKEQLDLFHIAFRNFMINFPEEIINKGSMLDFNLSIVDVVKIHSSMTTELMHNNIFIKSIGKDYSDDIFTTIENALVSSDNIDELKKIKEFLAQEKQYLTNPAGSNGHLVNLFKAIDYNKTDKLIGDYLNNIENEVNNRLQHLEHIQKQDQENINNIIADINTTCQQIYNANQKISRLVNKHKNTESSITNIITGMDNENKNSSNDKKNFLKTLKSFVRHIFNKLIIPTTNYNINVEKYKINMLSSKLNNQHQLYYKITGTHYDSSFSSLNPPADSNINNLINEQISNKKYSDMKDIASDLQDTLISKLQENNDVLSVSIDSKFVLESRGVISQIKRYKTTVEQLEKEDKAKGYDSKTFIDDINKIIVLFDAED